MAPSQLRMTQSFYMDYKLPLFTHRIYQMVRRIKFENWLQFQREMKQLKPVNDRRHELLENDPYWYDDFGEDRKGERSTRKTSETVETEMVGEKRQKTMHNVEMESETEEAAGSTLAIDPAFAGMTVSQLKIELDVRGLVKSGRKDMLLHRLQTYVNQFESDGAVAYNNGNENENDDQETFAKMTVDELKVELDRQGLPVGGKKNVLLRRLQTYQRFIKSRGMSNF